MKSVSIQPQKQVVSVLLNNLNLKGKYDYLYALEVPVHPGDYVQVPWGSKNKKMIGVVWEEKETSHVEWDRLKSIELRFPVLSLPEVSRRFIDWVSEYTLASAGMVLRMAIGEPTVPSFLNFLNQPACLFRLSAQFLNLAYKDLPTAYHHKDYRRVYEEVCDGASRSMQDLIRETKCRVKVIHKLVLEGFLESFYAAPETCLPDLNPSRPVLSAEQEEVVQILCATSAMSKYQTFVLDGVTGSGKTEVYCEAIETYLRAGYQVLVLLPEVALTSIMLTKFTKRFGIQPTQWHSEVKSGARRKAWNAIVTGESRLIVGARSALLLPYRNLGLIIVDEEHEGSFKQEEQVIYHARDMAVVRAFLGNIPICLVSATPSLETIVNLKARRYHHLELPNRYGTSVLPEIQLINLRQPKQQPDTWISSTLHTAIVQTLEAGEQVLLFLNRRGYAPITVCRSCGYRLECEHCSTCLVEHRHLESLQCHYCGFSTRRLDTCPRCAGEETLVAWGPGVERIDAEVERIFPQARRSILTSDTLRGTQEVAHLFEDIHQGRIDILIGTQVIAKGYHFPLLTLVGVIDGDLTLNNGDLRASERTYQLLQQIAGRSGRATRRGRALIQTFNPDHVVMQSLVSGDRERFLNLEIDIRRHFKLPPFSRLVGVIVKGKSLEDVDHVANELSRTAPRGEDICVFGPAPAPISRLQGRYRKRFLIKAPRKLFIQKVITEWLQKVSIPYSISVSVDIDPYTFL